jgi:hypothetical protein
MRCRRLSLGVGVLIAGLAFPSLLLAQEPTPDRPPPRPPREAPPSVDRPQTRDPGPVEKPARERPTRRNPDAADQSGQQGAARTADKRTHRPQDEAPVATGPARMPATSEAREAAALDRAPPPPDTEAPGQVLSSAPWRAGSRTEPVYYLWPDFVRLARPLCQPGLGATPGYAVAYWTGEHSPLLEGDRFALLDPGRAGVVSTAFGTPGANNEGSLFLCEPDPEAAASALIGAAARNCAVVSTRGVDGQEQNVAIDLPRLGAFSPVVLRQKIVERLQAGEKIVVAGRHQRMLRLDASVVELDTRSCRAGDL